MQYKQVTERAKDALGILALAYGIYGDVMFSWRTLTRGNEALVPGSEKGSMGGTIQNLFLTGFYNGIRKSQAVQEQALPQDEVIRIEQQVEQQVGQTIEKKLIDEIKSNKWFDKFRGEVDDSLEKLAKTDAREALLKEDIFSANILHSIAKKRFANREDITAKLAKVEIAIQKGGNKTVGFLLGNAMWLGELVGASVGYAIDLCPEATKNLKIGVEKLLELEIYNKYLLKQFLEELYSTVLNIYKLSLDTLIAPAEMLNVALAGIYEGLTEEGLSYNMQELAYRDDAIEEFLQMLENKTVSLEELLDKKGKQIDRDLEEVQAKIKLIQNPQNKELYVQRLDNELTNLQLLQRECGKAIEMIDELIELRANNAEEYQGKLDSVLTQLNKNVKGVKSEELDAIFVKLRNGEDVLDEAKQYFQIQKENYTPKIEELKNKIQALQQENYIASLKAEHEKLQVQKDIFRRNISSVLVPVSFLPWKGVVPDNMSKLKQEKGQDQQVEKKLLVSMKKNLSREKEMMQRELIEARTARGQQAKVSEQQKGAKQHKGDHEKLGNKRLDKLVEELKVRETWMQYGKRIVEQQIRDYGIAKKNYLENVQKTDKKVQEKGLSGLVKDIPVKHKAQYQLTARKLLSEQFPESRTTLNFMDNMRASISAGYLLGTTNVFSISKNTAKYISEKVNAYFSSQELGQGK